MSGEFVKAPPVDPDAEAEARFKAAYDAEHPPAPVAKGFEYDNTAKLSDGPIVLGKKMYHNATRGFGASGLASPDGTLAGAADEMLALGLAPTGAAGGKVTAVRDTVNGTRFLQKPGDGKAPDVKVEDDAGGGGDSSEHDKENERILRLGRLYSGGGPAAGPAAPYFQQEGASKAGIGGEELYDEAFKNAPARRQAAMEQLGAVQEDRAKELAALYDRQAVQDQASAQAMAVKQQQDQQDIAQRQEELSKATKFYTRDLNDQGKFWANPGNIIAAISYSLMPIFSNDPTVGVKLINQAVQQDLDNRTRAADQNLGHMRANLDGYRKIAGDRQQGDLLARAEAHRMAANEIARVGAKFGGPEAAKQMQVAIEDQKTRAAAAEMEFYAKYVHTAPKKTVPQETAALYKGPGGWAPLGQTAGAQQQGPASPVNGEVQGTPSQVSSKGFKSPVVAALARTGGAPAVDRLLSNPKTADKVSDKDIENVAIMLVRQEAQMRFPGQPGGYAKVMKEEQEKLQPITMELQKTAGARSLIAKVRGTMQVIEKTEVADGRDPEAFLGWARTAWPKSWVLEYEKFTAKDPRFAANNAEAAQIFRAQKAKELRAALAGVFNQHTHELFGGAQSEQELAKAAMEAGDKSSWHQTAVFLDGRSQQLNRQAVELKGGLTPMQRVLLRVGTDDGMNKTYLPQSGVRKAGE